MNNVVKLDKATHQLISGYYSRIDPLVSETMTVRQWLAGKSFAEQYRFGLDVLEQFGVNIP